MVERVIDGDTLKCKSGKTIRLLLIDAPEMDQGEFGAKAKLALEKLAPEGSFLDILTDVDKEDRYGRTLAHLKRRSDGKLVNGQMLLEGMAVISVYQPNVVLVDSYRTLSEIARKGKKGLWAENGFECLPSDFRSGDCGQ